MILRDHVIYLYWYYKLAIPTISRHFKSGLERRADAHYRRSSITDASIAGGGVAQGASHDDIIARRRKNADELRARYMSKPADITQDDGGISAIDFGY